MSAPISIVNQQVGIVSAILNSIFNKANVPEIKDAELNPLKDNMRFLLSYYVYADLKPFLHQALSQACIIGNVNFIKVLFSVMEEKKMKDELMVLSTTEQ